MQESPSVQGMVLSFEEDRERAMRVAQSCGMAHGLVMRHRVPDGEIKLTLPQALPSTVVLWRGLEYPNEKLAEVLLVAGAARDLGARQLTLLAPYLAYMRQDIAFAPGEAVSQRIVGRFLAGLFDAVVTVDPHLHRVSTLQEAIPVPVAAALSAAPVLAAHVAQHRKDVVLVGPDEEAMQWVEQAAAGRGWTFGVCRKVRHGDRDVSISLPCGLEVDGRTVVLMDDVASSGHTLVKSARALLEAGARSVDVAVTHALFAGDAVERIRAAGVGEIWSTDCIPHATNAVSMVPELARTLQAHGLTG
ncbi:MAG: ribose-phosphate diphosphokinase [Gammaproteobacteria bacterium]